MINKSDLKFINPWRLFYGATVPNWLLDREEVTQGAKLCYARLCQFAGKKGECFPKQKTLAMEIGIKPRQVRNYLKELEDLQLIFPVKFKFQSQNLYRFLYHPWMGEEIKDLPPKRQYNATLDRQSNASLGRQSSAALYNTIDSVLIESKEAAEIYDYYAKAIKPGAKEDAIKSIGKLLKSGITTKEGLLGRVNSYKKQLQQKPCDSQFYILANNFFGQKARYKDYEPVKEITYKAADPKCLKCKGQGRYLIEATSEVKICQCRVIS